MSMPAPYTTRTSVVPLRSRCTATSPLRLAKTSIPKPPSAKSNTSTTRHLSPTKWPPANNHQTEVVANPLDITALEKAMVPAAVRTVGAELHPCIVVLDARANSVTATALWIRRKVTELQWRPSHGHHSSILDRLRSAILVFLQRPMRTTSRRPNPKSGPHLQSSIRHPRTSSP